jgi:hypothetical protein
MKRVRIKPIEVEKNVDTSRTVSVSRFYDQATGQEYVCQPNNIITVPDGVANRWVSFDSKVEIINDLY